MRIAMPRTPSNDEICFEENWGVATETESRRRCGAAKLPGERETATEESRSPMATLRAPTDARTRRASRSYIPTLLRRMSSAEIASSF
jgi:hypothetical protein